MKLLIKNGCIVDAEKQKEYVSDILIEDGIICKIDKNIKLDSDYRLVDANGMYVFPGFVDMHAHLRDPGLTDSEDLVSAGNAAASGGFTTVCAMPNTIPAADCVDTINYVNIKSKEVCCVNIIQAAALTVGQKGEQAVDFEDLYKHGVNVFSDDGQIVASAGLMNEIMKEASRLNLLICDNCDDYTLSKDGVMNESLTAKKLELKGKPNIAEDSMLARNLCIAKHNKARYHACHCSTAGSVELISLYKPIMKDKLSAEVTPHHIFLCDEDITEDNADYKMNPPLRSRTDRQALIDGLKDGVIDVIATDHAPHLLPNKQLGFRNAPFGIISLQTAFPICVMSLIDTKILTLPELAAKLSYNPAKILGIDKGVIKEGAAADICVADINEKFVFSYGMIKSKSHNSPFINKELKGRIKSTIVGGEIVYCDME